MKEKLKRFNNYRDEKGSITLFVLLAILFFIIVLFALYYNFNTKNAGQKEEIQKIIKNYDIPKETIEQQYEEAAETKSFIVTLSQSTYEYDGKAKTPAVIVKDGTNILTDGMDYSVSYNNNVNAGIATVTVVGKGAYFGQNKTVKFTIERAKKAEATVLDKTYNGSVQIGVQGINVLWSGTKSATNVGNYAVTATPSENYAWADGTIGSKTFNWKINAKSVNVEWENVTIFDYNGQSQAPKATANSGIVGETINLTITGHGITMRTYVATANIGSVSGGQARAGNYILKGNTMTFQIVDSVKPIIGNVSARATSATSYMVNITNIYDDGGSGLTGICISTSNYISANDSNWVSNSSSSYTFNGVDPGQSYYVFAKDGSGNISDSRSILLEDLNYDVDNSAWYTRLRRSGTIC